MKTFLALLIVSGLAFSQEVKTAEGSYLNISVTELKDKLEQDGQFFFSRFHTDTLPLLKERLIDTGELQYVYRDYISVGGALSQGAAETAECLREQVGDGRYIELINALYAVNGRKNTEQLLELASVDAIDEDTLNTCVSGGRFVNEIAEDMQAGREAGIRGTPGFILGYINEAGLVEGMVFQGALPFETFDQYVRAFLEANN